MILILEQNVLMLTALDEIAQGKGAFKPDPLEHAVSTIDGAVTVACSAYKEVTGEWPDDVWPEASIREEMEQEI